MPGFAYAAEYRGHYAELDSCPGCVQRKGQSTNQYSCTILLLFVQWTRTRPLIACSNLVGPTIVCMAQCLVKNSVGRRRRFRHVGKFPRNQQPPGRPNPSVCIHLDRLSETSHSGFGTVYWSSFYRYRTLEAPWLMWVRVA